MSEKTQATLIEKLVEVYRTVDHVAKRGTNESQNYKYVKASDLAHAVRNALADLGIYAEVNMVTERTYEVERKDKGPMHFADVRATISFRAANQEIIITSSGLGSGMDAGDKAIFKAQTGALKYALRNAFLVPDDADPENDGDEKEPETKAETKPAKTTAKTEKTTKPVAATLGEGNSTKATQAPKAEIPSELPGKSVAKPTGETAPAAVGKPAATPVANAAILNPIDGDALPNEEQVTMLRNAFSLLSKDLKSAGLESGKGKPVGRKLTLYLLHRTGTKDPDKVTYGQWQKFLEECRAYNGANGGYTTLAEIVEKISGGK